eukprot:superscaffoldBa00002452_g14277
MPISSACLVFDGACPPHWSPRRPRWSRHGTSDSSTSLQLAGICPKGHGPCLAPGAKMADGAGDERRGEKGNWQDDGSRRSVTEREEFKGEGPT